HRWNRRCFIPVLVARRPLDRLLRRRQAEEDRVGGRTSADPCRRCGGSSWWYVGSRQHDSYSNRLRQVESGWSGRRSALRGDHTGYVATGGIAPLATFSARRSPLPV